MASWLSCCSMAELQKSAIAYTEAAVAFARANPVAAVAGAAFVFAVFYFFFGKRKDLVNAPSLFQVNKGHSADVSATSDFYTNIHSATGSGSESQRLAMYDKMVDAYYTLSTDFYEFGWGQSFHFGHRYAGETHEQSILRHEYSLASRLGLREGMKVLDVGCGVGGPARNIARFSGANVTGVTLCEYQVARATAKTASEGLSGQVDFKKADFMKLDQTIAPGTYDAAYAIEATCHAPDRTQCFSQVFKALKPGAVFGGYEWVSTPNYDPSDPEQRAIMSNIEVGNGLPTIKPPSDVVDALKAAGFEVEVVKDLAPTAQVPWYQPFLEPLSMKGFGASRHGIAITRAFVLLLEALGLAKKGTAQMHYNLTLGALGLVEGGKRNLFTVMLLFIARKPAGSKADSKAAAAAAISADPSSPVAAAAPSRSVKSPAASRGRAASPAAKSPARGRSGSGSAKARK